MIMRIARQCRRGRLQLFMIVNLAWPRPEIYGVGAWYLTGPASSSPV